MEGEEYEEVVDHKEGSMVGDVRSSFRCLVLTCLGLRKQSHPMIYNAEEGITV